MAHYNNQKLKVQRLSVVILLILPLNFAGLLRAQSCTKDFIAEVLHSSQIRSGKFHKKVRTTLKNYSTDFNLEDVKVLNIPVVFPTKEGAKISGAGNLSKEKLICYLDGKSLIFDEALIVQDTIVLGAILQCSNSSINLKFNRNIDLYRVQLAKAIIKINPDIFFCIYNIPQCFWYIKDNELFALSYERKTNKIDGFVIYKAKSFIEEYLNEKELCFLSHKRVIVISGR